VGLHRKNGWMVIVFGPSEPSEVPVVVVISLYMDASCKYFFVKFRHKIHFIFNLSVLTVIKCTNYILLLYTHSRER
jgi:hypothetical protein